MNLLECGYTGTRFIYDGQVIEIVEMPPWQGCRRCWRGISAAIP